MANAIVEKNQSIPALGGFIFFIWILNKFRQSPCQLISKDISANVCPQWAAVVGGFCLFTRPYSSWCSEGSLLPTLCAMIGWVLKPVRGKKRCTTSRLSPSRKRFFYWYVGTSWHSLRGTIEHTAFNHLESTTHQASSFQTWHQNHLESFLTKCRHPLTPTNTVNQSFSWQ